MHDNKSIVLASLFIFSIEILLLLVYFRKIRSLFPLPEVEGDKIIGYSQYFGSPFYFDTFIFFFVLVSIPLIIVILNYIRK